jgi:hypothetical protein
MHNQAAFLKKGHFFLFTRLGYIDPWKRSFFIAMEWATLYPVAQKEAR